MTTGSKAHIPSGRGTARGGNFSKYYTVDCDKPCRMIQSAYGPAPSPPQVDCARTSAKNHLPAVIRALPNRKLEAIDHAVTAAMGCPPQTASHQYTAVMAGSLSPALHGASRRTDPPFKRLPMRRLPSSACLPASLNAPAPPSLPSPSLYIPSSAHACHRRGL